MIKHQYSLRLPSISKTKTSNIDNSTREIDNKFLNDDENQKDQVTKLEEWVMNKPTSKTKNNKSHNISFLYKKNGKITHKEKNRSTATKYMEISLYVPKIDHQLKKIGDINYFSIFKNMQYCSGVYANQFNGILKTLEKFKSTVQNQLNQQLKKLSLQREQHLQKIHQLQQCTNSDYKDRMHQVREVLQQKQKVIKPLKKVLKNLQNAKIKVLKFCLALGYDVRQEGLIWIIKQLGEIPKVQEFPQFLSQREKMFIIQKYKNQVQIETSNKERTLKTQICGKTIDEAYEFMNRRKRRQLSLIKQNQEMLKLYAQKIKDYSPDNHKYLYDATLQIAQNLQKQKAKPTKYEIIYNQTVKKLNRICREQIYQNKNQSQNKQNKQKKGTQFKRKSQRNTTLIISEFSKMLIQSMNKTKKNQDLRSKEQKQLEEILRQIRVEKYNKQNIYAQRNLHDHDSRNPISILSCLMGWKKGKKIIDQEMMNF